MKSKFNFSLARTYLKSPFFMRSTPINIKIWTERDFFLEKIGSAGGQRRPTEEKMILGGFNTLIGGPGS